MRGGISWRGFRYFCKMLLGQPQSISKRRASVPADAKVRWNVVTESVLADVPFGAQDRVVVGSESRSSTSRDVRTDTYDHPAARGDVGNWLRYEDDPDWFPITDDYSLDRFVRDFGQSTTYDELNDYPRDDLINLIFLLQDRLNRARQ